MNIFDHAISSFCRKHGYHTLRPEAALIDMDGTLYDSMKNHTAAWFRLATELGIPAIREEFYLYEGRTGASTINILFRRALGREATAEEIKELYHRKTVYFSELPPVEVMPGAPAMIKLFEASNIKRVLVTGSGQSSLINRLAEDFPGAFTPGLRITSRDVEHGKPSPEPYLKALEKAGVPPYSAIAVENAPLGVESAVKAGVFTIAVTTGPIQREAMEQAGADVVFDSMEECAAMMPMLLQQMFSYDPVG